MRGGMSAFMWARLRITIHHTHMGLTFMGPTMRRITRILRRINIRTPDGGAAGIGGAVLFSGMIFTEDANSTVEE